MNLLFKSGIINEKIKKIYAFLRFKIMPMAVIFIVILIMQ